MNLRRQIALESNKFGSENTATYVTRSKRIYSRGYIPLEVLKRIASLHSSIV